MSIRSDSRSRYVLAILGLVSVMDYYDRNLIGILAEPIEHGLHLDDARLGLLSGVAFAVAYGFFGIPIAGVADRYGQVRVLTVSLAVWTVMTALTAFATGFISMALARIGVAIGEAGAFSTIQALVTNYFPFEQRGRALSAIGVCGEIGLSLALFGGGALNAVMGWRMAYIVSSLPGFALTLALWLTVREPRVRNRQPSPTGLTEGASSGKWPLVQLLQKRAYVYLCLGIAFAYTTGYGQFFWEPTFLIRIYHLSTEQAGIYSAVSTGPAAILGVLLGGVINDRLARRSQHTGALWLFMAVFGTNIPVSIYFFTTHDLSAAITLMAAMGVLIGLSVAPLYALLQNLAGRSQRATAAAVASLIINVVGLSAGPYLGGVLSDKLTPICGVHSLGTGLSILNVLAAVSIPFFYASSRRVSAEMVAT